jgi:phosphatidylinositol 3-kinase
LRQDALIIQLLRICDAQLKRVGLDLHLTPYSVVATGKETGMMEMVLGSLPVSAVLENSAYARGSQGPVQAYLKETNPYEGAGTSVPSPRPSHSPPRLL